MAFTPCASAGPTGLSIGDLYGASVVGSRVGVRRGYESSDRAEALVEQMDRDSMEARKKLAAASPLSHLDERLNFDGR